MWYYKNANFSQITGKWVWIVSYSYSCYQYNSTAFLLDLTSDSVWEGQSEWRERLTTECFKGAEKMVMYGFLVCQEALESKKTLSPRPRKRTMS